MWDRVETFVLIVIFLAGMVLVYLTYLIGIPFVWLKHGQPGVELWKESFFATLD